MYQSAKILFLYCETPLHAGAGEGGLIDLPIQRESHTEFPKIESSSLKGALRETFRQTSGVSTNDINILFGPDMEASNRGSMGFSDARLLLFPVRSAKGIFAWATCRWVLENLVKDMSILAGQSPVELTGLEELGNSAVQVTTDKCPLEFKGKVMLEEYVFEAKTKAAMMGKIPLGKWLAEKVFPKGVNDFWKEAVAKNLVIMPDEAFRDFTVLHTNVITRNRIDPDTGIVVDGGLFTEEYLPPDSVLYSIVTASQEFKKEVDRKTAADVMKTFEKLPDLIQVGGNATIGKGLIRTHQTYLATENENNPSTEKTAADATS